MNTEKNAKNNKKTDAQSVKVVNSKKNKSESKNGVSGNFGAESKKSASDKAFNDALAAAQDNRFQSGTGVGFEQDR